MINVNEKKVDAREIYNYIGVKSRFNDWFKNSIDFIGAKEGIDFYQKNSKSTGGRPTIEYDVTIDCAKELCLVQRTEKSKELRQWLISISKKVENADLVSREQVMGIVKMIKVFSIYEYRKLAMQKNAENFVNNAISIHPEYSKNRSLIYGKFHQWRNEVLQTGKEVLAARVKEYCLIERKRIPAKFTQDEALTLMGEYEQIKNAIWDLLCSQGKSEEMINNICALAHDLAKEMKPFLERLNQSNLFFNKLPDNEIKGILG
jgi:phage anti-repressor protein